ncbi:hypothetical protein [Thioalbus denitrificans]|uniref:Cytochrome c oxidase subunit 2 n=1 Tax=Thioalbus denitrificans TaxID=547122 RepID=A0A369C9M0_9GAMM|nr:hypothetical protein [Thioalbus denitrificans]RCX30211.1 cytochrome c oxidase subunit 2 [Thioalbus denitrificans]
MLDFLYQSGWGAFTIMLLLQIPFVIVFLSIVYKKAFVDSAPSATHPKKFSRVEVTWLAFAGAVFLLVNILSISYMPMVSTAHAAKSGQAIQEVDVTARSWSYDISERTIEAGVPVRFSAKSADTMHSFSVYHPDGRVLFTMQLLPGLKQAASTIYTFTEPGRYTVRCLEYCGIVHHGMRDELVVVDARG